jgi:hypothetical protein
VFNDFPRRGDLIKQRFTWTAAALLLIENRLTELNAFSTDVDVTGTFNERSYITVALPTKRTECVLLVR